MSDSEEDFFASQMPQKREEKAVSAKKSVVEYFFLVIFDWNLMAGSPFQMHVWETMKDFPEGWIKGPLSRVNRKAKIQVSGLGGENYSLFCKVEKGTILYSSFTLINNYYMRIICRH